MKNNNNNKDNQETPGTRPGGLFDFIQQTNVIGNVIAAAATQKNSFEPLPFSNSSLFEENYDESSLRININPFATNKHIFLPKTPITVSVSAERKHGAHIFHPYNYTLSFTHGEHKWEVVRTFKEIKDTHKSLSKIVKQDLGRSCSDISQEEYKDDWPLFPTEHDHLISSNLIGERCKHLAEYLKRMLTYPPFRDHPNTLQLLGVSPLSFMIGLSSSHIEYLLPKRTGDNVYYGHFSQIKLCCDNIKIRYAKRWFILKDTYIVYTNLENNNLVGFAMLVDRAFRCETKIKAGAYHAVEIRNLQRNLILKFKNAQQQKDWHEKITWVLNNSGRCFNDVSLLKNGSYAPVRRNQLCKWYVNSAQYMEHVMMGLNNAKEEIFITDWWFSPELFLKRPTDDLQFRLDKILLKKSREGVKIYIMLFKEVSFAIGLLSYRVKNLLTQNGTNANIRVLRHPEHSPSGVFLWSHHEKMVIIDQSVAFFGGIDLCFGRWDDDLHRLIDLGRQENRTELDPPVTTETHAYNLANLAQQIQKYPKERAIDVEKNTGETDLNNNLDDSTADIKIPLESPTVTPSKPDALIVAALMGNSIAKFKLGRNNRLTTQLSAPAQSSPVYQPDTPTNSLSIMTRGSEKSKSFNMKNEKVDLRSLKTDDVEITTDHNKSNISAISATSSKKTNKHLNTSKFGSKASKYLNVPTDPTQADVNDVDSNNRKDRVKRRWDKFKKTVKRRSHNPLNRLRRRSSGSDSSGDYSEYTDSDEEGRHSFNEEKVELPIISNEGHYWIGKDYSNTYKMDFKDVHDFSRDQFDRTVTPRMPWRDEGLVVIGEAARDLARHFIQRWNQCKREKVRQNDSYPFLLPKSYQEPFNYDYTEWFKEQFYKCEVQMTRSLDAWSGGISETEFSILNSYCDLIQKSEHYIYIENQFFVTTTDPVRDTDVKNMIGGELVERIMRAFRDKKKFRVYVVLPLLPGFDNPNAIQAVQYYNLRSIINGDFSIYKALKNRGVPDPFEYITFYGMRNWSVLMGKLVQEIIYVHSKLMIVDDKYVICGSANVNDRSMLGKRDSEIAAVVKDEELFQSVLDGQKVLVGKYANSLRKKIFKLHLGIYFNNPNKIDVQDCVCDEFYNYFRSVSKTNTEVYDEVFKCLPSDNITDFQILASYGEKSCLSKVDPPAGKKELDEKVNGFIVDFPLKFLCKEKNFFPDIRTPEGMVPIAMWT
ncbi:unnamed protein product [Brachionus calyciflorus]|uniref:Phospholipase n=1 Tax=Brachionus calyciflorus TaxID=104777 RepID=A0A813ULX4_9BILA|nr:unnamed protein product [Brachionus calyciflorus]